MFVLCCVCFTLKCQDFRCFYKFNVTGQYSYTFKNIVNQCSDANTVCDVCPVFSFHLTFSSCPFLSIFLKTMLLYMVKRKYILLICRQIWNLCLFVVVVGLRLQKSALFSILLLTLVLNSYFISIKTNQSSIHVNVYVFLYVSVSVY